MVKVAANILVILNVTQEILCIFLPQRGATETPVIGSSVDQLFFRLLQGKLVILETFFAIILIYLFPSTSWAGTLVALYKCEGHVKNNEAKMWQNGHEMWKMNPHSEPHSQKKYQIQCKMHQIRTNCLDMSTFGVLHYFWHDPLGLCYLYTIRSFSRDRQIRDF